MPQVPLGNGYYVSSSPVISNQLCTNWYANYPQAEGLSQQQLLPTPGLTLLTEVEQTGNRGGIVFQGEAYIVNGNTLFRIEEIVTNVTKTYVSVALGNIASTTQVSIAKNNTQIIIVVPGLVGYIFDKTDGLQLITNPNFLSGTNVVVYLAGFFVLATDTKLFTSALNDGSEYDFADFAEAEVDPDNIISLHVFKNQLYVLGVDTTEVFENVGNPEGFPLQRVEGFIIDKGVSGIFAVATFDDSFVFVGSAVNERAAIWVVRNNQAEKISTTAIDVALEKLTDSELAFTSVISYAQDGAYFAVFSFTNTTFVYDSTASGMAQRPIWHTRESLIQNTANKWRVVIILQVYGLLLVADLISGQVGHLDLENPTEFDGNINRLWSSPPIAKQEIAPLFLRKLEVNVENGNAAQDEQPVLGLAISSDGGRTYGNTVFKDMGTVGEFETRLIWDRLGRYSRYFALRLEFSGNTLCRVVRIDAVIE